MRFFKNLFGAKILADCGHKTFEEGSIKAFGEKRKSKIKLSFSRMTYCFKCQKKMIIKCAFCEKPIFIGDPIVLIPPRNRFFQLPARAIIYSKKPVLLIGCLRMDCIDKNNSQKAFWFPPGKVKKVPSFFESAVEKAGFWSGTQENPYCL
jgi:hypothetical protein